MVFDVSSSGSTSGAPVDSALATAAGAAACSVGTDDCADGGADGADGAADCADGGADGADGAADCADGGADGDGLVAEHEASSIASETVAAAIRAAVIRSAPPRAVRERWPADRR